MNVLSAGPCKLSRYVYSVYSEVQSFTVAYGHKICATHVVEFDVHL